MLLVFQIVSALSTQYYSPIWFAWTHSSPEIQSCLKKEFHLADSSLTSNYTLYSSFKIITQIHRRKGYEQSNLATVGIIVLSTVLVFITCQSKCVCACVCLFLQDAWSDSEGNVSLDSQQDYELIEAKQKADGYYLLFRRPFSTCDPRDYLIEVF